MAAIASRQHRWGPDNALSSCKSLYYSRMIAFEGDAGPLEAALHSHRRRLVGLAWARWWRFIYAMKSHGDIHLHEMAVLRSAFRRWRRRQALQRTFAVALSYPVLRALMRPTFYRWKRIAREISEGLMWKRAREWSWKRVMRTAFVGWRSAARRQRAARTALGRIEIKVI